jgi:predicted DNA-binding transcriptional regulator AlpA
MTLSVLDPSANGAAPTPLAAAVVAPLLADGRALGHLLCLGLRTVRAMDSAGKLPRPIRLGARTLWSISEIQDWIEAGAPDRQSWEARKAASRK